MHEDGTEHFLGEREAAEYLGVAESVLRKWCEAGLVRCTTVTEGGDEYQVKDLDRALASAFSATFPPLPNDAFVGRSRLIAQARKQLAGNQLLTITGPPGVGKTRVAFELCRLVSRPRVYVNAFAVETLEVLLRRVAAALDFGQKDAPTQADLSRVLADQGALLLVDDADELDAKAAACLARWARSTGRESVVATSRTPLRVTGEVTLPLPPLATEQGGYGEPAAASLLRCRAQQHDATLRFDRDDLVRIAARLDGLPLALELAAPILARLGPRALLTPVQTLQVLKQTGRDAPDHHASMSLCIYWSWRSLDEDAQQALTRLSVFRGPFDHDMALVVLDSLVADELIGELAARSLLQVIRPGEWRVLRVVGEFACQRDPPEFERARHAHAEAMGQFAAGCVRRARSVSGNSTGREVHTYQANLLHAFDFSMTHQRAELAHTLGACLCLVQVGAAAALETTRPALDLNAPSPEWKVRLATARLNLRGRLGSLDLARTELERVQ